MLSYCHPPSQGAAFTEQQLKQLRAQCLVFLAVRNNKDPTKKHLEIALDEFSAEGSSSTSGGGGGGGDNHDETGTSSSSSPVVFSLPTAVLPPPDRLSQSPEWSNKKNCSWRTAQNPVIQGD